MIWMMSCTAVSGNVSKIQVYISLNKEESERICSSAYYARDGAKIDIVHRYLAA